MIQVKKFLSKEQTAEVSDSAGDRFDSLVEQTVEIPSEQAGPPHLILEILNDDPTDTPAPDHQIPSPVLQFPLTEDEKRKFDTLTKAYDSLYKEHDTLSKEHSDTLDYVKQLENKNSFYRTKMLQLENQVSTGTYSSFNIYISYFIIQSQKQFLLLLFFTLYFCIFT